LIKFMPFNDTKKNLPHFFVVLILVLMILISPFVVPVQAVTTVQGTVLDEFGIPINVAQVSVWFGRSLVSATQTNIDGHFILNVEQDPRYSLLVFADLSETQGIDYFPSIYNLTSINENFIVELHPAASLMISDDLQFVEIDDIPNNIVYSVYDSKGEIIDLNGFSLIYSSNALMVNLLGLNSKHIIVPSNHNISIGVHSNIRIGQKSEEKNINITEPLLSSLEKGERFDVDIRPYYVAHNIETVESYLGHVYDTIDHMETIGFYMVSERNSFDSSEMALSEAKTLLSKGEYVDSFSSLKRSYINLVQNQGHLEYMLSDAVYSVDIIIVFLSLASTTVAFLLTNKNSYKVISSVILYALSLAILYYTYPGSTVIPFEQFITTSFASLSFAIFLAIIFPRYLKGRERDGIVPLRNILVPLFSMAKRSIQRRRLRFILTSMSITLLIVSFVSLTSISESYGVIQNRLADNQINSEGILLRASGYGDIDTVSLNVKELSSNWLDGQIETLISSIKIENSPRTTSIGVINGEKIWGFLGIDAEREDKISDISGALFDGVLPSYGQVAISRELSELLDVGLNDEIMYHGFSLTVKGILYDDYLKDMKEFDGSWFLPGKLFDLFPEERYVIYEREPCLPRETLFFNTETAMEIQKYDISRISIVVNNGVDQNKFGERLALERDYWVYSSTDEGLFSFRLGKYLEGKGLQLLIPWVVVILNVVVTMLNSMYERKKEIQILSSLGINPSQIATIFIAEASIIGLTAGGIGYLAGISLYKVLAFFGISLGVQQKVSAAWSLASIGISVASVLVGAFVALRGSVIITPSLRRKWSIDSPEGGFFRPWTIPIPVRLVNDEVEPFVNFMVSALNKLNNDLVKSTSFVRVPLRSEEKTTITFAYKGPSSTSGTFYTKNTLLIDRSTQNILVTLDSWGERDWAHETGSLVRMIAMRWSTSSTRLPDKTF